MYEIGDLVTATVSIRNSSGTLTTPATISCTITLPDGTSASVTPTLTGTGQYSAEYAPATAGQHLVRWVSTSPASAHNDGFIVIDPGAMSILSLADAKAMLNITSTASDEELRETILEAVDIAERKTGRKFRRTTHTDSYDGGRGAHLVLRHQPVVSVTSVTESGTALAAGTDYVADLTDGILVRGQSTATGWWAGGNQNVTVVYVSGETSLTARRLVKELTRHLWRTQRGASPMAMGGEDTFVAGANNIYTYRVLELIETLRLPGFA